MSRPFQFAVALATLLAAGPAAAFCGFYVSGAEGKLSNSASHVVLMRSGTRTVLSMQNDYRGPPEDFALVVPVPEVLEPDQVKILPDEVFARVDVTGAPRLVEYWEVDPCWRDNRIAHLAAGPALEYAGIYVLNQFKVGEYDITILGADDSTGLSEWLQRNGYKLPPDAARLLAPYVERGSKFLVAKVDVTKIKLVDGRAVLSALRIHYDAETLSLPIRLGMLNADGAQDLIVSVLAREHRYEVANRPNVTIPTNIVVDATVRKRFSEFYAALFDQTLARNPGAWVTEYAWDSDKCDPCPPGSMTARDYLTLGQDVTGGSNKWVLTRLHGRYSPDDPGEDLVFRQAPPLAGGRGQPGRDGSFASQGSAPAKVNNFQARYAILNPYAKRRVRCKRDPPDFGLWGPAPRSKRKMVSAKGTALARRGRLKLSRAVREDVASLGLKTRKPHRRRKR